MKTLLFGKLKMIKKIKASPWRRVEVVMRCTDPKTGEEWTSRMTTRVGAVKEFLMRSWGLEVHKKQDQH